ncbi:hypothetical protein ACH95_01705 [Bacillus glycinifermentans]|uniref:Uncharacterized protein n=1 Tax=Bacillus glycinifermentans TaxID=1664069 RepID=A0A0J6ENW6_9BACI|nr:hypothetical protein COP00_17340 [Bacillus glycinifermentans]OJT61289.1 hypothetical protein BFP49_16485 [Bacillus licheniformis]KMM63386.1 hypothetical protein ACH95_01705 [Bacillus glycinifermentans]KRT95583.1 hypothetical protein AB447_200250 [Bacillus glycinifermentans]TWM18681.1 hypothetical protein CHCC15087_0242 [Bacillus licheniformis]
MNKFVPKAFQMLGIVGFILAFLQMSIGWFIGFFFTGLFFMTLIKEDKRNKYTFFVGIICFLYSFYCLFTQVL